MSLEGFVENVRQENQKLNYALYLNKKQEKEKKAFEELEEYESVFQKWKHNKC